MFIGVINREGIKNSNRMIKDGISFVSDSFLSILLSGKERREIIANEKKSDVLNFIRETKGSTVLEISDKFNIPTDVTLLILKKLEDEKKIVMS